MRLPWAKGSSEQPRRRMRSEQVNAQRSAEQRGQTLFRRNRTLIGSLSPQVSSANELGGDLRSPRAHIHHLTAHRRRLVTILALVVAAIMLLAWLLFQFTAGMSLSSTSPVPIDDNRYHRAIDDYFAAHPLERLRALLNERALSDYLAQVTPEVERAQATGSAGFATTQFVLTFRQPVVGWQIGSRQYYVDSNGVSFETNYFDKPTVMIIDQSGVPETTGTTVASGRFLRFVARAITLSNAAGLTIKQAVIPASTTHEIEVILAGHDYPIKLSLDRPVGEQIEDMQHAVNYFDTKGQRPQYIDIRVSGKAYYK